MSDPEITGQVTPAEEPNASHARISPGAQLSAYRNERGWTVEQVASQLNLAPRQIVAIESDDFAALPGMPIVRGFIRAYAKLLKVEAAPLLATLDREDALASESIVPRKTLSTPFSEARLPSMTDRPGVSSKWIIGVLLVLLLGVAIWASRQGGSITEIGAASTSQPQQGRAEAPTADNSGQNAPFANSEEAVIPTAPATGTTSGVGGDAGAASTSGVDAAPAPVQPAQQMTTPPASPDSSGASPSGNNTLRLSAREDSWVEIRRAGNNSVLVSRIVKAGESESVEVTEPVLLVIGNAAGVDANLRGTPLELKPGTKSNVARVNLK